MATRSLGDCYGAAWPLLRALPAEWSHHLGLLALRSGLPLAPPPVADAFEWRGLRFRNRVGIAAGFDKDGVALPGLARLGAGFAEIGTIVTRPWAGNPERPRLQRRVPERALWNRLGFPSQGLERVSARLRRFAGSHDTGMCLICNIAPHPQTVRSASSPADLFPRARAELEALASALHPCCHMMVLNLSSPNTPGLRGVLFGPAFAEELVAPTRAFLARLDREAHRAVPTALLVKLPPEDAARRPWSAETLARVVAPLADSGVCDGFVAVNTSSSLALERVPAARPESPGGLSGAPLLGLAVATLRLLAELAAPGQLRIGVGGVMTPDDAVALLDAGAQLVEVYSGLIYRGPRFVHDCAEALRAARPGVAPPA
jgi:dihydroorotate dehydrogenase